MSECALCSLQKTIIWLLLQSVIEVKSVQILLKFHAKR